MLNKHTCTHYAQEKHTLDTQAQKNCHVAWFISTL